MNIASLMLLIMFSGITRADLPDRASMKATQLLLSTTAQVGQINSNQIKITIATGGGPYQPAKDTFRVGDPVPLVITMTNTGSQSVYICRSDTLYQDRPQLLRDGEPVLYTSFRRSELQATERDNTCKNDNLPQQILLRPNESTVVDWFNLAEGAASLYHDGWYKPLPPGKYTLRNQRRLSCCDGALLESNKINFVVVP